MQLRKNKQTFVFIFALSFFFAMIACSGGGGGEDTIGITQPKGLEYESKSITYFVGKKIEPNMPTLKEGKAILFTIEPSLPEGLVMDAHTGVITGTPLWAGQSEKEGEILHEIKPVGIWVEREEKERNILSQMHTITASNPAGSTSTKIKITVSNEAPTNLQYTRTKVTYYPGMEILPNAPSVTGGAESYTLVSRTLPADLVLDSKTGVITGTPRSNCPEEEHIIQANNPFGSTRIVITIAISNKVPANLKYPNNPAVYYPGSPITPNIPTVDGAVEKFSILPELPKGLTINEYTGIISGTPTDITPLTDYTVTAENRIDKTSVMLQLGVLVQPPLNLQYSDNPAVYFPGVSINPNVPSVNGGVTGYSVVPALPTGLFLDTETGILYGTPVASMPAQDYRITARNPVGIVEVDLNITVSDSPVPANLRYSEPTAVYFFGNEIVPNRPTVEGLVTSYRIEPALPNGLEFSKHGTISGIPIEPTDMIAYVVTASNPLGSTIATLNLQVSSKPPLNLTYSTNPALYYRTQTIVANIPSVTGVATSYTVSPNLPQGLVLDTKTGYITGTPQEAIAQSNFFVSASNPMGSTVVPLVMTIYYEYPVFVQQPISQILDPGASANFSVLSIGIAPMTYQWLKNGNIIQGATFSSYSIAHVTEGDEGNYSCKAENSYGTATSQIAILTVNEGPSIVIHPQSQAKNPGTKVVFTVIAQGTAPLSYQWGKDGNIIPGATLSNFSIDSVQNNDEGLYRCFVSNNYGSIASNEAILTVNDPPVIIVQPESKIVDPGKSVSFSVVASREKAKIVVLKKKGKDSALKTSLLKRDTLSYQWQKNESNIANATHVSYQIPSAQQSDEGNYRCIVTNSVGSVISDQASLTVNDPPIITANPASQAANVGNSVSFIVMAEGSTPMLYQWRKNKTAISGANGAKHSIVSVSKADEGNYSCYVYNSAGNVTSSEATLTVNFVAPNITRHPISQTVNPGSSVLFVVEAEGSPVLSYQWQKGNSNISGETFASLQIVSASQNHEASYRCIVTNTAGSVTSNEARLTVNDPPLITTQPVSQTVLIDASVSFSVVATGTLPMTYQWRKDGSDILNATASTYSITNVVLEDQGSYSCVVSNITGPVYSSAATLTVNYAPTITRQPVSQTVNPSSSVLFVVEAIGNPVPIYQWQKKQSNIVGATFSTFQIYSATQGDEGNYRCIVTNVAGSATSTEAALFVNDPPAITTQPLSQAVNTGQNTSFSIIATGTSPLSYQWRKDGNDIQGATGDSYNISNVALSHQGGYSCMVSNIAGSISSNIATLTVNYAPVITKQPISQTVNPSTSVIFSIEVDGSIPLTYQWRKDGIDIPNTNNRDYTISSVAKSDEGEYTCYVSNPAGFTISDAATLTVNNVAPLITQQPSDANVFLGEQVIFTVVANGTAPLSYQWKKDTSNILNATSSSFTIDSVQQSDAAGYSCFVSNALGGTTSRSAILSLKNAPPLVLAHPQNQNVIQGDFASFSVTASGTAPLTYQWRKNANNITNATNPSYSIASVQSVDAGTYSCIVTNDYGNATSNSATLSILALPVIIVHPESQIKNPGDSVTFLIMADGVGPFSYQWQKDSQDIEGATFYLYQIPSVQQGHEGKYRCVVTNLAGSTYSNEATLTLANSPTITVHPQSTTVKEGSNFSLIVAASGTGPLYYQWQKDNVDIPGATSSTYFKFEAQLDDAGSYKCIVSNSGGSAISNAALLKVLPIPRALGPTYFLDIDQNGSCNEKDQLIISFNTDVTVNNATGEDFSLPVNGDSLGTSPIVTPGPKANQITITLGTNPLLTIPNLFHSLLIAPGDSSGIDIKEKTSHIVSSEGQLEAIPSKPVDISPQWQQFPTANLQSLGLYIMVSAMARDSKGNVYIGGDFRMAGGVLVNKIAKWNGFYWTPLDSGVNGNVNTIAIDSKDNVYVGGDFTTAGGICANKIAKWNGTSWISLGSDINGSISSIAIDSNDVVYVGGTFSSVRSMTSNNIAKWDGISWSSLGSGFDSTVFTIAIDRNDVVYAGGAFKQTGNRNANYIAKWDGISWSSLGSGTNDQVYTIKIDTTDHVYIGGSFTQAGGIDANYIARWDGLSFAALGSGTDNSVNAIGINQNGSVYIGGSFTQAGGIDANYIARWDGLSFAALDSGVDNSIHAIITDNDNLYMGGIFAYIAKWNFSEQKLYTMGSIRFHIFALTSKGNDIYLGGNFKNAEGVGANRIAKWDGNSFSSFGSGMNDDVLAIAIDSNHHVYAGGNFITAGGIPVNYIAKWNGSSWLNLESGTDDSVYAIAIDSKEHVYVGGFFTTAGGAASNYIAKWDGTSWSNLGFGLDAQVQAIGIDKHDNVYVGGFFTTAGGAASNYIAKWDGTSWSNLGSGLDNPVSAIAIDSNNNVYAGGYFRTAGGIPANYIAKWNGTAWSSLGVGADNSICTIAIDSKDNVYAGGYFVSAGEISSNYIAKWNGSIWSSLGSGVDNSVAALAIDSKNHVYAGGDFITAGNYWSPYFSCWIPLTSERKKRIPEKNKDWQQQSR